MTLRDELRAIFAGDDAAATRSPGLLAREDGMISILAVLTVFMFLVLAALVLNVGMAVNHKIEQQNAADAVARSCAVQRARTLNTVTAVNHLTGELLAVVVLHEAVGCRKASKSEEGRQDTAQLDTALLAGKKAHDVLEPGTGIPVTGTPAYDDVHSEVYAVYALLDGYKALKQWLVYVYGTKAVGLFLEKLKVVPIVGPACEAVGIVLYESAHVIELWIWGEWKVLDTAERLARASVRSRELLYQAIPRLRRFAQGVLDGNQRMILDTARAVGRQHGMPAIVYPPDPRLGLDSELRSTNVNLDSVPRNPATLTDPATLGDPLQKWGNRTRVYRELQRARADGRLYEPFRRSQVVRATYPWVDFHRLPIINVAGPLVFSDFGTHYRNWSSMLTLTRCADYYRETQGGLHVIHMPRSAGFDIDAPFDPLRKGREPWAADWQVAEPLFTNMGFVYRPPPDRWARGYFRTTHPNGTLTFAQAAVYNANAQQPGRVPRRSAEGQPLFQPEVGWDTLNWASPVETSRALEWPFFFLGKESPQVKLNWQAKLVPVSRLDEVLLLAERRNQDPFGEGLPAADRLPEKARDVLQGLVPPGSGGADRMKPLH